MTNGRKRFASITLSCKVGGVDCAAACRPSARTTPARASFHKHRKAGDVPPPRAIFAATLGAPSRSHTAVSPEWSPGLLHTQDACSSPTRLSLKSSRAITVRSIPVGYSVGANSQSSQGGIFQQPPGLAYNPHIKFLTRRIPEVAGLGRICQYPSPQEAANGSAPRGAGCGPFAAVDGSTAVRAQSADRLS
jgi:hypothetical protein